MLISPYSALFSTGKSPSVNPYDLITGKVGDLTTSALTPPSETSLTYTQDTALQSLKDYVTKNVKGDTAGKLQAQIAAVEGLMRLTDRNAVGPDPVFALLAGNSSALSSMPPGLMLNALL